MQQKIETEVLQLTQAELKTVLDGSGIPFVYRAWKNGHDLPFGVFYFERDNPFAADGIAQVWEQVDNGNLTELQATQICGPRP